MRIALAIFAVTFLPGLPLAVLAARWFRHGLGFLAVAGVLGLLWTVAVTTVLAAAAVPAFVPIVIGALVLPLVLLLAVPRWRRAARPLRAVFRLDLRTALVLLLTAAALIVPLVTAQQGLPTGDIQKSIFWAERIRATGRLPEYGEAVRFNRDPGDFAVPGLHALTAAVSTLTGDSLRGPAWFSLFAALLLAAMAAALAAQLGTRNPDRTTLLAFVFAATNPRFLRYTQAPGYHYQNLIGELFLLLAFLFLLKSVGGRGGVKYLLGAVLAAAALPLVHQFSAFLGVLLLPMVFAALLLKYRREIGTLLSVSRRARRAAALAAVALVGIVAVAAAGPVREKLPHLITDMPHLRPYVIPLSSIPVLLGVPFTLLGAVGALVVVVRSARREIDWRWLVLLLWCALILVLSQGARSVLDTPSARTLFYVVTPWSVLAALAASTVIDRIRQWWPRTAPWLVAVALALLVAPTAGASLNRSLQAIDHGAQANATLTPATLELLSFLSSHPPACNENRGRASEPRSTSGEPAQYECQDAILIDDWNHRRTTWTILSPYRMLTRVGADLAVIAREAGQSPQRRTQYETLLDFEQIYALGNSPEILPLLARHGIAFVVGAKGLSDDVFAHNPALEKAYENSEVVLYASKSVPRPAVSVPPPERFALANDIGDAEDVFAHLPLALLAPQISGVLVEEGRTAREVVSAVSAIGLNVGTYLPQAWDADGNRVVDQPVELTLEVLGNGARGRITRGTNAFTTFALPDDGQPHALRAVVPAGQLPIDEQGLAFLTVRLDRGPLRVDRARARLVPLMP